MTDDVVCPRCERLLHTGEGRILVAFTTKELAELAGATIDGATRERLLTAISLLDSRLANALR